MRPFEPLQERKEQVPASPAALLDHVKDVDFENGKRVWLPVGAGKINYHAELQALKNDGYDGIVALETHFRLPGDDGIQSTRQSYDGLMSIINELK